MNRAVFRFVPLAALLFVLGCCCTTRPAAWVLHATPCTSQPQDHVIEVYAGKVSCDPAYVSRGAQHHIEWFSAKGTRLEIRFPNGSPFRSLTQQKNNVWQGFDIDASPDSPPFKYDVWIDGKKVLDPSVIIKQ